MYLNVLLNNHNSRGSRSVKKPGGGHVEELVERIRARWLCLGQCRKSVPLPPTVETGLDREQGLSRVGPKLYSQQRWLMQVNSSLT